MTVVGEESSTLRELRQAITNCLDPFAENRIDPHGFRLGGIQNFLTRLRNVNYSLGDLSQVIAEIKSVTSGPGTTFEVPEGSSCLSRLSKEDQERLQEHLKFLVDKVKTEFPELVREFPKQFGGTILRG
jgi:hypothetical protein